VKRMFTTSSLLLNCGVLFRKTSCISITSFSKLWIGLLTVDRWQDMVFDFSDTTQIQDTKASTTNLNDSLVALKIFKYVILGFVL
jgi:hypothetical protein